MTSNLKNKMSDKRNISPSFVKLAMKNMVRKGSQSLNHMALTFVGFLIFIIVLASLARPTIPG